MESALTVIPALLAGGSLILSGVLKLGRPDLVRAAMAELRVPRPLAHPVLPRALPPAEVVVGIAVLLATGVVRTVAAAAAVLLHLAYLVVVARAVSGRWGADCHCFGDLTDGPVSRRTVARNAVLLAAAGAVLLVPDDRPGVVVATTVTALVLAGAVLLRLREEQRSRPARPDLGELSLVDVDGSPISLGVFADPPTVLVFFSPDCGSCRSLVPYFRWWPSRLPDGLDLQPVFPGRPENFADIEEFAPLAPHAWYDPDQSVASACHVVGTPAATVIGTSRPLSDGAVAGRAAIEDLLRAHGAQIDDDTA